MKKSALVVTAIVGIAALLVASYLGGWWLKKDVTQRQYDVNTNTQQYQAGLIAQERDLAKGIATTDSDGLKRSLALQFCSVYPNLTVIPVDIHETYTEVCP